MARYETAWRGAKLRAALFGMITATHRLIFVKPRLLATRLGLAVMISVLAVLFSVSGVVALFAADKVRISMTGFAGQFMTFPLAQKRGFLKEEGFEAKIIRISAAAVRPDRWSFLVHRILSLVGY